MELVSSAQILFDTCWGKYSDYKICQFFDKLTYAGNLDNLRDIEDNPNYKFVQGDTDLGKLNEVIKKMN